MSSKDFRLINEGSSPTCVRPQGTSVVDLTWATASIQPKIDNWKVLKDETYSDHKYIYFTIKEESVYNVKKKKYNRWKSSKMDIDNFQECIEWNCTNDVNMYDDPTHAAEWLQSTLTEACNYSMPKIKVINRKSTYWWNNIIEEKRNASKVARRKLQRGKRRNARNADEIRRAEEEFRTARKDLRTEINRAKHKAWKELVDTIEEDPWGLPYKVVLGKLRKSKPGITETLAPEILMATIEKLFPSDTHWNEDREVFDEEVNWNDDDDILEAEVHRVI